MNLEKLTNNAGFIGRVQITDMVTGTIQVGGSELPTVTFKGIVEEALKGSTTTAKGNIQVVEMTMVGSPKADNTTVGDAKRLSVLPSLPELAVGGDYLVFATPESSVGLCVTVGLGQGYFRIYDENKTEVASNELNNAGLFRDMTRAPHIPEQGPIAYTDLADLIRGILNGGN